tara:strand:+ start:374 stop:499 length:126 start_codon:yes stop_codon:yes gene_type:complete
MIDTSPSSIRVFAIIVLSIIWLYLLVEQLAVDSIEKDKKRK